ncbi:B-block-TFIIIC domain-containing protein [Mycena venus]|uniref:B-block-TFIIIC domain-containing protein n=1 Tax=Mycena venus TaxID=2733690 RepID=A0A8H6XFA1_9AGAR|nr:B-block-TFIIIC domain-containing protein [Mycena venus]
MDNLLHHCLRELSFSGDLGCNVSCLRDFIVDFYSHSTSKSVQNADDAFCAFVWSLVVQQPSVIVGTLPEGVTSEVWIAPQNSAKRKAKAKGEETVEVAPPRLDIVPDAKNRSLEDLKTQYGDKLRIATDPDTTYAAITGTHIRFPKMSPMVYSALQIIARGRDNGVSVLALGQTSKYDQKTCFYLVRQLVELDLIVKQFGTKKCVQQQQKPKHPHRRRRAQHRRFPSRKTTCLLLLRRNPPGLHFTPIDARHLSSMPLVKGRIIKLLKASKNLMHASNNMLIAIGFANPTKTDRRFFASRTRELVEQGVIENVFVPGKKKHSVNAAGVKCFRLVSATPTQEQEGIVVQSLDDDPPGDDQSCIKMNLTIHKQIISLIEESGTVGMTLNELAAALAQFDKRTVELLLTRAEKFPPPAHLSDLGIAGLMETSGRERRNRYFTIASYQTLVAREKLDKDSAGYADVDLSDVGGFYPFAPETFYTDHAALIKHQDRDARLVRNPSNKPSKKKSAYKNPLLPDGTVKKGRPRKERPEGEEFKPRKRKRKVEDGEAGPSEPKKKRRLNGKQAPADDAVVPEPTAADADPASNVEPPPPPPPKRKGRPPKNPPPAGAEDVPVVPKKRGRPKKELDADAQPPKKRGREAKKKPADEAVDVEEAGMEVGMGKFRLETAPRLPSLPPAPPSDMPLIPPVAILPPPQSSPPPSAAKSSPLTELDDSFDELGDEDVEDASAAVISDDTVNPPLSPTLLTSPLFDDPMSVDSQGPDAPKLPLDSVIPIDPAPEPISDVPEVPAPSEPPSTFIAVDVPANKPKVNVSTLRRENELFRVLEDLGGIVNTQVKEVYDAHQALLITMAKAGETTSAPPGTRLDRRTANAAFNNMELRGKVKQLKTTVSSATGLNRPANIVYFPDIEESRIKAFIVEQGRNTVHFPPYVPSGIVVDEHTEYGSNGVPTKRKPAAIPVQLLTGEARIPNPDRADELFSYDEETVREVLLTERTTLGQMYGFIPGKLIRARELHLHSLNTFEKSFPSSNIVSHELRIAHFPFLHSDIPIGLYCAIVGALEGSDDLYRLLSTEEGRNMPAKDIPSTMHSLLQVGRTRGRGRVLELLEILRSLGLATPLEPCEEGKTPLITCAPNGSNPTSFQEVTSEDWGKEATGGAPDYWHFASSAPVYHWAESETNPPFLKDMPLVSCAEAVEYWNVLREACCDRGLDSSHNFNLPPPDLTLARKKAKTIRRRVSWTDGYSFTWHQTYYLNRFVHGFKGQPPLKLDSAGADETIRKLCRTVSAPENAVREFLEKANATKLYELEKANRRIQKELQNKALDEETKASLAVKAAEARAAREEKWDGLVKKVHPGPLGDAAAIRLRRVRTLFLQATGTQTGRWEREIAQAVHEADMATAVNALASKRGKYNKRAALAPPSAPSGPIGPLPAPPVVANPPEKSIASLIAAQGPLVIEKQAMARKPRRKGAAGAEAPAVENQTAPSAENRLAPLVETESALNTEDQPAANQIAPNPGPRTRFHWNKDYDELAKDAFAIINSRCRSRGKLDYGAVKQVFPGVNKSNVRQHMKQIRDSSPAMAAYMSRLEDHWHELWLKYRGSALLPDDDPISLKFDLIAHIEFLRKHVDKNALRVGFLEEEEKEKNTIPGSVEELLNQFDIVETPSGGPAWDFIWSGIVDENREKRALRQAFTTRPDDLVLGTENSSDAVLLAESILKMAMGTSQESYDAQTASWMLHNVGEENVNPAQKNLLSRGVLAKRFKNPNSQPGRMLKISDGNQNAIGGSIPHDTFQDAAALEDISTDDHSWREWPLLSTDGDTAALIQLVSDNKVDFKIDTTQAQGARAAIDWNSKKAGRWPSSLLPSMLKQIKDDDHIETAILVRFHDISIPQTPIPVPALALAPMEVETVAEHGTTEDGSLACCKRVNEDSLIDCAACLEGEWGALYASIGSKDRDQFQLILDTVTGSGAKGITKRDLLTKTKLSNDAVYAAVQSMTECAVPLVFWAGYQSLVLVASSYLRAWTVQISTARMTRIFPRRWIDTTGSKVMDLWEAATRAVMGVLVFHPGVTQTQLRWRLRSVYDRQEVNEVLRYLYDAQFISVRGGTLPAEDEERVSLFVGSRHCFNEMRVKQIWDYVPLPAKAKLVWNRLTFSKLTTAYVIFSLVHFALQISLQIRAFTINADAATLLYSIALQGNATNSSFPALAGREIRMCASVPTTLSTDNCTTVYDGTPNRNNSLYDSDYGSSGNNANAIAALSASASASSAASVASAASASSVAQSSASLSVSASATPSSAVSVSASPSAFPSKVVVVVTQIVTESATKAVAPFAAPTSANTKRSLPQAKVLFANSEQVQVNITGLGYHNYPLILDRGCMWSLNWPVSVLDNTKREDIVFIAFQFWVLGMSAVALLNESIPHIIASLLTHVLATAWSAFQLSQTAAFHKDFTQYITNGACSGVPSLLPTYWDQRNDAEIPTLALNLAALLVSCVLTWKLVKLFGWQTFKRVGASLTINRVYKLVLLLSITLQLSLFFMGATVSLFLDQLINGWIGHLAWYGTLYKVMFIITGVLLIPWLMLGWFSVRREMRLGMIIFLGLSVCYLAGWGIMFMSTTFRWTFRTWSFFSIVATASVCLAFMSFVLGVVCRLNFGKGLLRYLNAHESLPGDDFTPVTHGGDPEKVSFPSNEKPVPTFSATFGSGSEVPVPSQMFRPSPQLGPRFFNSSAEPFESRPNSNSSSPISPPMAALTRSTTKDSYRSTSSVNTAIPGKRDSDRSFGSLNSYYDYSSEGHRRQDSEANTIGNAKRWVIDD